MGNLRIYKAVFAVHEGNYWRPRAMYVVARDTARALDIIGYEYGEVKIRELEPIEVKEGMFFGWTA